MKHLTIAALSCAAIFLSLHRPASAMVEFCPAHLNYERVGTGTLLMRRQAGSDQTGGLQSETLAMYGLDLSALGPRTITSATLIFDTSDGWYRVSVPALTLAEKDRHYTGPSSTFVRKDFVSPIFYVRFPKNLSVGHAWVDTASAQGDPVFGWDNRGVVQCDPTPRRMRLISASRTKTAAVRDGALRPYGSGLFQLDPKDLDALSFPPRSTSTLLLASRTNPPSSAACSQAFDDAFVRDQVTPEFPGMERGVSGTSAVQIALDEDGNLVDAWIWGPSGVQAFDDAAVAAAEHSTYHGERAYCAPARSNYLFIVEYESRR